jgi:selenocysteine lyase/cysteine desulfurase
MGMPGGSWTAEWGNRAQGYLDTATYGLPPASAWDALQVALDEWRCGTGSWEDWAEATDSARQQFATLAHVDVDDIFAGTAVSQIIGLVAAAVPDGAAVLVPSGEFASVIYPWSVHADRGVTVKEVALDQLATAIDTTTDVVAFSLVQSRDGSVADIASITAAARAVGAMTIVDTTQATGWLPVDLSMVDVVACAAYKWLMCPRGTAFGVVKPHVADRLRPLMASASAAARQHASYYGLPAELALTARRFDISPAWHCWVGAAAALAVVNAIGVPAIQAHNLTLANGFRKALDLTDSPSAIVVVNHREGAARLERAGVHAAVRNGRLRTSFHVYNTVEDVEMAADALSSR